MSLFDSLKNQAMSALGEKMGVSNPQMMETISQLIEKNGGLSGLLGTLQQNGLKDQVQSWLGTGANLPVSADQIKNALGHPMVQGFAEKLGVNADTAAQMISTYLPKVIDMLTPDGKLPQEGSGMTDLMGKLKGLLK